LAGVVEAVLSGDRLVLSRLITEVENISEPGKTALDELFPKTGRAYLVGVTGAPGTGKSSLVNRLTQVLRRERNLKIAIVAVDPSSPFTGGAILGDRVRMRDLTGDPGVFIRSMATRGELGGLARATSGVVQVLDAAGYDLIIIETVGAGQSEVDIARLAHTTLVVEAPGMGDDIQAIKAGILEIADILVINKADLPGVESAERALKSNLEMGYPGTINGKVGHRTVKQQKADERAGWVPPVLKTIALSESGFSELIAAIFEHKEFLETSGLHAQRDRERLEIEFENTLRDKLVSDWKLQVSPAEIMKVKDQLYLRKLSPSQAVEKLSKK
jgi:LAO/AO transport system kinase